MKKRFLVFVPLVCLSLCALIALPIWVGKGGEQVEITQTTLEGDPAYAQGLTVSCHTVWDNHLFWETTFSAQDPAGARTELTTYQNEHRAIWYNQQLDLESAGCNFGISTSEDSRDGVLGDDSPWAREAWDQFLIPAQEFAKEMEPGTTQTFQVRPADWYDTWPMTITRPYSFEWAAEGMSEEEAEEQFQSFFSIPVPQDLILYYTLKMNENGVVYDLTVSPNPPVEEMQEEVTGDAATVQEAEGAAIQEPFLISHSLRGEQGWYLVLDNRGAADGYQSADLSRIRDGNGVILIPAEKLESGSDLLYLGEIRTVYPFPEGEQGVSIDRDQEGRLLVYTADETGTWYLTVLEEESAQVLQRLELGKLGGVSVMSFVEGDGIRLVQTGSERLLLLVEEGEGYRLESILPVPEDMMYQFSDWAQSNSAAWDGERLAVICPQFSSYETQMLAAVWQDEKLVYLGSYQSSLGRPTILSNSSRAVQLDTDRQIFQLEWS